MSELPSSDARPSRVRIVLALATIAVVFIGVRMSGVSSVGELNARVDTLGPWAFVGFVLAYALAVVAFVPASALTVAAGLVFGWLLGTVLVIVGATLGAAGAFLLARSSARPLAQRFAGRYVERIDGLVGNRTFMTVLLLRLLPLVPFSASNYAFGLARFRFDHYVLATAIGIIPGTAAYVAFGNSLADVGSAPFWYSIGALVSLAVVSGLIAHRIHRRDGIDGA